MHKGTFILLVTHLQSIIIMKLAQVTSRVYLVQLKPGCQIPSPSELMGKILIKNKKSSNETQTHTKKSQEAASTATSTQENQASSGEARSHFCVF